MSPLQRVLREPNSLTGAVIAGLGLAMLFGLDLSKEQLGGIVTFLGAVVLLLRQLVVPAQEVVAQRKPGEDQVTAGPAATVTTGTVVDVMVAPRPPVGTPVSPPPEERGAAALWVWGWVGVALIGLAVALSLLPSLR